MSTRRYSQLIAPRRSEVVEASIPEPGAGEVLVEIKVCGVCASELHPWGEPQAYYPRRLGHEPAGIVRAVGPGVTRFQPGDRVTGLINRAFSEFEVTAQENLLPIPQGVEYELAMGEPLACLVNALRRTSVELGDLVAVVGLGFMGLAFLQLLKLRGPRRIIAIDVRSDVLQKAAELGADEIYHPEAIPADYCLNRWEDWQKPVGIDVVMEASGTQAGLALASKMVKAHGMLSILGFHQGAPRQVDMEMWNWKAIDVVNAHVRRHADLMSSMGIGLDLVAAGKFSFAPLISHRLRLSQVDDAYTALLEKPEGFIKAVVIP